MSIPAVSACNTGSPGTFLSFALFLRSASRALFRLLVAAPPCFAIFLSRLVVAATAARDLRQKHSPKRDRRCHASAATPSSLYRAQKPEPCSATGCYAPLTPRS